jgi:TRAP-type C4-dicarboxylate transport system permease small subunit
MSWVYIAAPTGCVLIAVETLRLMARTWAKRQQGGAV